MLLLFTLLCFGLLKNIFIRAENFLSFVFIESFFLKKSKCLLPFLRTKWWVFLGEKWLKMGYKESGGRMRWECLSFDNSRFGCSVALIDQSKHSQPFIFFFKGGILCKWKRPINRAIRKEDKWLGGPPCMERSSHSQRPMHTPSQRCNSLASQRENQWFVFSN